MQLEAFLGHWRHFLQPQHGLLFSQLNGAPMTAQAVYKAFQTSAFRISGKKTNPHLVRDMVVTYLRWEPSLRNAGPRRQLQISSCFTSDPSSEQSRYKAFQASAFRIFGKKTNPHLI